MIIYWANLWSVWKAGVFVYLFLQVHMTEQQLAQVELNWTQQILSQNGTNSVGQKRNYFHYTAKLVQRTIAKINKSDFSITGLLLQCVWHYQMIYGRALSKGFFSSILAYFSKELLCFWHLCPLFSKLKKVSKRHYWVKAKSPLGLTNHWAFQVDRTGQLRVVVTGVKGGAIE